MLEVPGKWVLKTIDGTHVWDRSKLIIFCETINSTNYTTSYTNKKCYLFELMKKNPVRVDYPNFVNILSRLISHTHELAFFSI